MRLTFIIFSCVPSLRARLDLSNRSSFVDLPVNCLNLGFPTTNRLSCFYILHSSCLWRLLCECILLQALLVICLSWSSHTFNQQVLALMHTELINERWTLVWFLRQYGCTTAKTSLSFSGH